MEKNDKPKTVMETLVEHELERRQGVIDVNEVIIIVGALLSLTGAVMSGAISQDVYSALMGAFMGYTFGRIFNHAQGKE